MFSYNSKVHQNASNKTLTEADIYFDADKEDANNLMPTAIPVATAVSNDTTVHVVNNRRHGGFCPFGLVRHAVHKLNRRKARQISNK